MQTRSNHKNGGMKGTQTPGRGCQLALQAGECHENCALVCKLWVTHANPREMVVGLKVNFDFKENGMEAEEVCTCWYPGPRMAIQATRTLENPLFTLRHRHSPEWGHFDLELTEPWFTVHQQRCSTFVD